MAAKFLKIIIYFLDVVFSHNYARLNIEKFGLDAFYPSNNLAFTTESYFQPLYLKFSIMIYFMGHSQVKTDSTMATSAVESPNAKKLGNGLPCHIKAVALQNSRQRFFVPSKQNYFAGEKYEYVMVDSGCNSFLLPFRMSLANRFTGEEFKWVINASKGTGAVNSPTLIITHRTSKKFELGQMSLAGADPILPLTKLRFHLGLTAAEHLEKHPKLSDVGKKKITAFLKLQGVIRQQIAAENEESADEADDDWKRKSERSHVLLGQYFLGDIYSAQAGKVLMMCDPAHFPTVEDYNTVDNLLDSIEDDVKKTFPEFDELEDEDHDGDDEEEVEFEYIDEPNY